MTAPRFVEVALPLPLFQTSRTRLATGRFLRAGSRVLVPVRNKRAIGISLGPTDGAGIARPRAIISAPDAEPVLSDAMLALCKWMAEYYVVPLGIVMRSVLPVMLTTERAPAPPTKTLRVASIVKELPTLLEREALFKRAPRQRALYEVLEQMGGRGDVPHLTTQLGFGADLVRALETKGLIAIETSVVARDPFSQRARIAATPHEPSLAQADAIAKLVEAQGGRCVPAARHHRQRKDARLHRAAARDRDEARAERDRARARDRAHAADRRPLPRRVRRRGRRAALAR